MEVISPSELLYGGRIGYTFRQVIRATLQIIQYQVLIRSTVIIDGKEIDLYDVSIIQFFSILQLAAIIPRSDRI